MHLLGPCRWSPAQVDAVLQTAGLPATSRVGVEKYLSVYTPKC